MTPVGACRTCDCHMWVPRLNRASVNWSVIVQPSSEKGCQLWAGLVSTLVHTACHDYALQEISVTPYTRTVLCLVFELMLYWLLFEFHSMLLLYAYLTLEFEMKRLRSLAYNFLCQMILTMWSCIVYRDMLISKPEQMWTPDVNISNPLEELESLVLVQV